MSSTDRKEGTLPPPSNKGKKDSFLEDFDFDNLQPFGLIGSRDESIDLKACPTINPTDESIEVTCPTTRPTDIVCSKDERFAFTCPTTKPTDVVSSKDERFPFTCLPTKPTEVVSSKDERFDFPVPTTKPTKIISTNDQSIDFLIQLDDQQQEDELGQRVLDDLSLSNIVETSGLNDEMNFRNIDLNSTLLCQPCNESINSNGAEYNPDLDGIYIQFARSTLDIIRTEESALKRRPMLSILSQTVGREQACRLLNFNDITKYEWAEARKHAKFPGAGKPNLPRPVYFRQRMEEKAVSEFIEWMHASNSLQNLSFGQKVVQFCNGVHTVIEAVKMTKNVRKVIQEYAEMWMDNMRTDGDLSVSTPAGTDDIIDNIVADSDVRCKARCRKTKQQCFLPKDHHLPPMNIRRHSFTPKGKLSPTSIEKILGQLTAGKIRSLAGLDNTDVEKGTENFLQMKSIVHTLTEVGMFGFGGNVNAKMLIERIDKMEEFHKVNFAKHLGNGK